MSMMTLDRNNEKLCPILRDLMTNAEAAEYLGQPISQIDQWRWQKLGPAYLKYGGRIWYRRRDIDAWLLTRIRSTQECAAVDIPDSMRPEAQRATPTRAELITMSNAAA